MINIENINNNYNVKTKIREYIDKTKIINFEKIDEHEEINKKFIIYNVNFFDNIWFLYDFLVYVSKCFDKYNLNFSDSSNKIITDSIVNDNFKLDADNIEKNCKQYRLNVSVTCFIQERAFTICKNFDSSEFVFVTNNDDTKVDLLSIANSLKRNYLLYMQSEHIYSIIKRFEQNDEVDKISLLSSFLLIDFMLNLSEKEYINFYDENIKWMEENLTQVNSDKNFWNELIKKIEDKLIALID